MPGAEEMALFDRIGALIRGEDDRFDLIMFDTAPTGHTLRLIRMPELMEAWIRALSRSRRAMLGIEQDDATDPVMLSLSDRLEHLREFRARLLSPRISAFVLVLVAERLPIEETARAIEQLQDAGVTIGGMVVNRVLPETSPDPFLRSRHDQEQIYLDEIDRRFTRHARVRVPQLPSDVHGVKTLEHLAGVPDRRESPFIMTINRPDASEFAPFYAGYIGKVPDSGPVTMLEGADRRARKAAGAPGGQGQSRLRGRQVDREGSDRPPRRRRARVQLPADAHRPRRPTPLAGFDENAWAKTAPHAQAPHGRRRRTS